MEIKDETVKKEVNRVMNIKFIVTVLALVGMTALCIRYWNADGSYQVELSADKNDGYQWTYTLSEEGIIDERQSYYANGLFVFVFEGRKEGTVEVDFVLKEKKTAETIEKQTYRLKVNPDKRIILRGLSKE